MAELNFDCEVTQAINFQKDKQCIIGHLQSMKIGDFDLTPDIKLQDPEDIRAGTKIDTTGVISNIEWGGGIADPINFFIRLSVKNKQNITQLIHKSLPNIEVIWQHAVYDYDPEEKRHYKTFHTDGKNLKGLINKKNGNFIFSLSQRQCEDVVSLKHYEAKISIMPQEEKQEICCAVAANGKFIKYWGISVDE